MKIRVLNEENIKEIMSMKGAIEADKLALKIFSEKKADIPLRANIDVAEHNGQSLYMYGYAAPANASGVKIVSVYPDNIKKGLNSVPATMINLNSQTGEVNCLMDGTYLTRLRTGAVSGAATDILARKDSKIFALFGTGGQAESQLEAILNVRKIEEVRVFDLSKERAEEFAKKMKDKFKDQFDFNIEAAESSEEAVNDADIITCVTTAKNPVFDANNLKKGAHINAVGSYTPEMSEISEQTLLKADKIYVDTFDAAKESGDILKPIQSGNFSLEDITGELGEVISNKKVGRENDDEITFFETTGNAVLDLVVSQKIYEGAEEKNIGSVIDL
ncbi:MAG: ornithine cyclodeaminase family protein [Anaerococcus sp.]